MAAEWVNHQVMWLSMWSPRSLAHCSRGQQKASALKSLAADPSDSLQDWQRQVITTLRQAEHRSQWIHYSFKSGRSTYVTCSNEMSRMSANLISRKHRINMQQWISTILTFYHQSILWYLFCQLAMLISRLYYYIVHFIAFLDTLRNISCMNFIKQNR